MSLTQIDPVLRRVARERIEKGQLPHLVPARLWGGKGAGGLCALCDKVIESDEMELEIERRIDGENAPLRFHVACHSLWRFECACAAPKEPEEQ